MLKTIEGQNQLISDMKQQIIQLNQKLQLQSVDQNAITANPVHNQKFF